MSNIREGLPHVVFDIFRNLCLYILLSVLDLNFVWGFPEISLDLTRSGTEARELSRSRALTTVRAHKRAGIDVSFIAKVSAKQPPRQLSLVGQSPHSGVNSNNLFIFCFIKPPKRLRFSFKTVCELSTTLPTAKLEVRWYKNGQPTISPFGTIARIDCAAGQLCKGIAVAEKFTSLNSNPRLDSFITES